MASSSTRRLGSVAAHLRASPVGEERKKSSAEECVASRSLRSHQLGTSRLASAAPFPLADARAAAWAQDEQQPHGRQPQAAQLAAPLRGAAGDGHRLVRSLPLAAGALSHCSAVRLLRRAARLRLPVPYAPSSVYSALTCRLRRRNEAANTLGGGGSLKGKTLFIAGGSRGIGFCIAKTAAKDGANIVIGGKTAEPHPTLPGTIYTAAEECVALGAGGALGCIVDVRDEDSIEAAVGEAVAKFGGIDILINCASAIFPQATEDFNARRFNLMFEVGPRGSMLTAKHCIPYLKESAAKGNNPHILNLSPPIVTSGIGQANYMINKLGMTISAISLSEELADDGVAGNTLWPVGLVTTSALNHMMDNDPEAIVRVVHLRQFCCPSTPR